MASVYVDSDTLPTKIYFPFSTSDTGQAISMLITCRKLSAYLLSICEMKLHCLHAEAKLPNITTGWTAFLLQGMRVAGSNLGP
jgi:hypothetical protein